MPTETSVFKVTPQDLPISTKLFSVVPLSLLDLTALSHGGRMVVNWHLEDDLLVSTDRLTVTVTKSVTTLVIIIWI